MIQIVCSALIFVLLEPVSVGDDSQWRTGLRTDPAGSVTRLALERVDSVLRSRRFVERARGRVFLKVLDDPISYVTAVTGVYARVDGSGSRSVYISPAFVFGLGEMAGAMAVGGAPEGYLSKEHRDRVPELVLNDVCDAALGGRAHQLFSVDAVISERHDGYQANIVANGLAWNLHLDALFLAVAHEVGHHVLGSFPSQDMSSEELLRIELEADQWAFGALWDYYQSEVADLERSGTDVPIARSGVVAAIVNTPGLTKTEMRARIVEHFTSAAVVLFNYLQLAKWCQKTEDSYIAPPFRRLSGVKTFFEETHVEFPERVAGIIEGVLKGLESMGGAIADPHRISADSGVDPDSAFTLGRMNYSGAIGGVDVVRSMDLLRRSAELGHSRAQMEYGVGLLVGRSPLKPRVAEGLYWIGAAFGQGQYGARAWYSSPEKLFPRMNMELTEAVRCVYSSPNWRAVDYANECIQQARSSCLVACNADVEYIEYCRVLCGTRSNSMRDSRRCHGERPQWVVESLQKLERACFSSTHDVRELAGKLLLAGEIPEAEEAARKAHADDVAALGSDHIATAVGKVLLARVAIRRRQGRRALEMVDAALPVYRRVLGATSGFYMRLRLMRQLLDSWGKGLDLSRGIFVHAVQEDGQARSVGVAEHGLIVRYAGRRVDDPKDLISLVNAGDSETDSEGRLELVVAYPQGLKVYRVGPGKLGIQLYPVSDELRSLGQRAPSY